MSEIATLRVFAFVAFEIVGITAGPVTPGQITDKIYTLGPFAVH